jgi:hypothetical protein
MTIPELLEYSQLSREVTFVVESVEYDKTTNIRPGTNAAMMRKIAQNVGQVKGTARQLLSCLAHMGCKVVKVRPLLGPAKARAKKDGAYFNKTFGWTGRTNGDKRDAALLALRSSHFPRT